MWKTIKKATNDKYAKNKLYCQAKNESNKT